MAEALAVNDGHDVEQDSVGLPRVEEGKQVWVLERRRDANLTQEPLRAEYGAKLRTEDLECDATVVLDVAGQVDCGCAAPADLSLDDIAPRQRAGKLCECVQMSPRP
jgi:hypothetical protein